MIWDIRENVLVLSYFNIRPHWEIVSSKSALTFTIRHTLILPKPHVRRQCVWDANDFIMS